MSEDQFTEVTKESWFGRIKGAIKGILFGLILLVVSFPFLFWNEGRAVKRYKTLKEGSGSVISVASDSVIPGNEGKLIHVSGLLKTDDILTDEIFGVSENAVKLERSVEMYQWMEESRSETKKKLGGGTVTTTTYDYKRGWSSSLNDSSSFKKPAGHENPGSFKYEEWRVTASNVTLGAFTMSSGLLGRINNYVPYPVNDTGNLSYELRRTAAVSNGSIYIGGTPGSPKVGDMRISFRIIKPGVVSVIARQMGQSFSPYQTRAGGSIELLAYEQRSADMMFETAQSQNTMTTWILRLLGFLIMMIGISMILKPLSVIGDVVPFIGTIVGVGTGIISFLVALVLSLITIAIAWLVYRPVLAVVLLVIAVGSIFLIRSKLKKGKAKAAASY